MQIISVMDYIGVVAFALSGAYVAIEYKLDIFGIFVIAFVTACGGGITRDVVMDVGVPRFFSSYTTIALVLTAGVIAILTRNCKWNRAMLIADAIGLAVFTVDTGNRAIASGYNLPQFLFVAVITAVGGGVIRDLLIQRVPMILRKEVYASAALVGAVALWFLHSFVGPALATYIALAVVFLVRMLSVAFQVDLPVVALARGAEEEPMQGQLTFEEGEEEK